MLTIDLRLLVKIEHQMLELLNWHVPLGSDIPQIYQMYTDAIFDAASDHLGRQVVVPQVLLAVE